MQCLILAAGKGSRLSGKGQPKPLVSFLGLPLVERTILTAKSCGIQEFCVVTGYEGEKVRSFLSTLQDKHKVSIVSIVNEEWEKENGISVLKAKGKISTPFLLMMTDHLVSRSMVEEMLKEPIEEQGVNLGVDFQLNTKPAAFLNEATKLEVRQGRVVNIGKGLETYNGLDTGLFVCSGAIFDALEESASKGDTTLSGGIRILGSRGRVKAVDMGDALWFDIDDDASFKRAEKAFLASLTKETDGPISRYINRPISTRITKRLVEKDLSPNFLTIISFCICILGAFLLALRPYPLLLLGGVLAQAASILDGCDGEVARLKFAGSPFGGWFDAVLDRYADAFLLVGLSFHSLWTYHAWVVLLVGAFAISGSLINSYTADKYDHFLVKKLKGRRGRYFRIGRDVRVFAVFLGAVLNLPFFTLGAIAVVMNLENLRRVWILYRNQGETS